jgi:hypothetical protein
MFYHFFLICTYDFIVMKDLFVILVNLDSLPIEVTGCTINDQELSPRRGKHFFFISVFRPSMGSVQLVMETSQAVNQLPYEVDCSPSSWTKLNVWNFALLLCVFKWF